MHESMVLHWPNITNCYVIVNLVYEANPAVWPCSSYNIIIFLTDRILVHSTRERETRIPGEAYITVTCWSLMR